MVGGNRNRGVEIWGGGVGPAKGVQGLGFGDLCDGGEDVCGDEVGDIDADLEGGGLGGGGGEEGHAEGVGGDED